MRESNYMLHNCDYAKLKSSSGDYHLQLEN